MGFLMWVVIAWCVGGWVTRKIIQYFTDDNIPT